MHSTRWAINALLIASLLWPLGKLSAQAPTLPRRSFAGYFFGPEYAALYTGDFRAFEGRKTVRENATPEYYQRWNAMAYRVYHSRYFKVCGKDTRGWVAFDRVRGDRGEPPLSTMLVRPSYATDFLPSVRATENVFETIEALKVNDLRYDALEFTKDFNRLWQEEGCTSMLVQFLESNMRALLRGDQPRRPRLEPHPSLVETCRNPELSALGLQRPGVCGCVSEALQWNASPADLDDFESHPSRESFLALAASNLTLLDEIPKCLRTAPARTTRP